MEIGFIFFFYFTMGDVPATQEPVTHSSIFKKKYSKFINVSESIVFLIIFSGESFADFKQYIFSQ